MQAFKERTVDTDKKVKVYRNLHNGLLSIEQGGLIVAHVEAINLQNVKFTVRPSGHTKTVATQSKVVHAYVEGFISGEVVRDGEQARYNPYVAGYFRGGNESRIDSANLITIQSSGYMLYR